MSISFKGFSRCTKINDFDSLCFFYYKGDLTYYDAIFGERPKNSKFIKILNLKYEN